MASRQPQQPGLQQLDVTSLKAVLTEWRVNLLPSRFEKAQQPDPQAIQLGLRSLTGIHWLELSWQPDAARLHRIDPPPRQGDGSTWPSSCSTVCAVWPWWRSSSRVGSGW